MGVWKKIRTSSRSDALRPTFLIVGAAKAGTTSLYEYLRQHPSVFMSENKEPCYFIENRYGVETLDDYLNLFNGARPDQARGESSTAYLSCPESAEWIRSTLGPIKIIVMLRNPARRAFSLYGWMAREGYEHATTFAEGLALEEKRRADRVFCENPSQFLEDYMYFSTGLYAAQVKRYFDHFDRGSVLVLLFEEFVKAPATACRTVFEFLGVDKDFAPLLERHNEGALPRSIKVQYFLRNSHRLVPWLRPGRVRQAITELGLNLNIRMGPRKNAVMSEGVYQPLMSRYDADIRALETLLGRDLSLWTSPKKGDERSAAIADIKVKDDGERDAVVPVRDV
jgi:hypothetical protein